MTVKHAYLIALTTASHFTKTEFKKFVTDFVYSAYNSEYTLELPLTYDNIIAVAKHILTDPFDYIPEYILFTSLILLYHEEQT